MGGGPLSSDHIGITIDQLDCVVTLRFTDGGGRRVGANYNASRDLKSHPRPSSSRARVEESALRPVGDFGGPEEQDLINTTASLERDVFHMENAARHPGTGSGEDLQAKGTYAVEPRVIGDARRHAHFFFAHAAYGDDILTMGDSALEFNAVDIT